MPFSIVWGEPTALKHRRGSVAVNAEQAGDFLEDDFRWRRFGRGVKDYRVIFVFENDQALTQFLDSGSQASARADAADRAHSGGLTRGG
jgi:hypothetical protein